MYIKSICSVWLILWLPILGSFAKNTHVDKDNAPLHVGVNKTRVALGQPIELRVTLRGDLARSKPNLDVLKKSFKILGHYKSQQMTFNQGQREQSSRWTLSLMPKQEGQIVIPAIQVGSQKSQPITIEVLPAAMVDHSQDQQSVYFEMDVTPSSTVVQSPVKLTVKLYYLPDRLSDGTLTSVQAPDALIKDVDEQRYRVEREGQIYDVLEKSCLVFPQKPGFIDVEGPILEGTLLSDTQQHESFHGFFNVTMMSPGQPIRLPAGKKTLQVEPPPPHEGPWLPAQEVKLESHWDKTFDSMKIGQPITRTVVIRAVGLMAEQLPDLDIPDDPNIQVYQDKPKLHTEAQGDTVIGIREQTITYIPTQPGQRTLPAIEVSWWDLKHQMSKVAKLPAMSVEVIGTPDAMPDTAPPSVPEPVKPVDTSVDPWMYVAIGGLLLWLLTIILWWYQTSHKKKKIMAKSPSSGHSPKMQLKHACEQHQPLAAKAALLEFAKASWPAQPPLSLGDLAKQVNDPLRTELYALQQHLYAERASRWTRGDALWQSFLSFCQQRSNPSKQQDDLPPLYP